MFTPNAPLPAIAVSVIVARFTQTSSIGGSSDSDDTALAVIP
jgi:hypothetical protein